MYLGPTIFDQDTLNDIKQNNEKRNKDIEEKCKEIIDLYAPSNTSFTMKTGETSINIANDLVKECYATNCDVLCVGSKGVSHSVTETVSDRINRVGHIADYLMHNAPCDVLVVKEEHDNMQLK